MSVFVGSPEEYRRRSQGTKCIACLSAMQPDSFGFSCENGHERVVYTTLDGPSYSTYSDAIADGARWHGWIVEKPGALWEIRLPSKKWWQFWK
jgi:hypothetical protein